jgi:hypothetical protein
MAGLFDGIRGMFRVNAVEFQGRSGGRERFGIVHGDSPMKAGTGDAMVRH